MISVSQALDCIAENVHPLSEISVPLEQAYGYVLAEDIAAGEDIPAFPNSAMDGYAVIARDTEGASRDAGIRLRIIGESPAGKPFRSRVVSGTAVRIATGGLMPEGADAVVRLEHTTEEGDGVIVYNPVESGKEVRPIGEDIRKGQQVLSRGTVIKPSAMGVLASLGCTSVKVFRKPRVAFLITGDELIVRLNDGGVRNSNQYSLIGLFEQSGIEYVSLGTCPDDKELIVQKLMEGIHTRPDMILTVGAVSVGKYDCMKEALDFLGFRRHFWKVAQRPGQPLLFGELTDEKGRGEPRPYNMEQKGGINPAQTIPVFGLPGNPVSVVVSFLMYVKPALLKMQGTVEYLPQRFPAVLSAAFDKPKGITYFARGRYRVENSAISVTPLKQQGSGMLKGMSDANCIIILDETVEHCSAGAAVEIIILN